MCISALRVERSIFHCLVVVVYKMEYLGLGGGVKGHKRGYGHQ